MSIRSIEGWAECWHDNRWSISRRRSLQVPEGSETWHWGIGERHLQPTRTITHWSTSIDLYLHQRAQLVAKIITQKHYLFWWLKLVLLPATSFGTYQIFLQKSHYPQSLLCVSVEANWIVLVSSCWQNTWINLKEGNIGFGVWFGTFQSVVDWPHCSMPVMRQNIIVIMVEETVGLMKAKKRPKFQLTPLPPAWSIS